MKNLGKISIITIMGLAVFGTSVFAKTGKVYNTSQGLVLRKEASKTSEALGTVENETEVEIIEESGEWYKVSTNGKEGFLFAEYVDVQEETSKPETSDSGSKSGEIAKVHIMPAITSTVIGIIPADANVEVEKTVSNWSYVKYENMAGWVRTYSIQDEVENQEEEIEEEETETEEQVEENNEEKEEVETPVEETKVTFTKGYINSESVNVRSEPNTSSSIVTTLILNTSVSIKGQAGDWYKVVYGDYLGYIYKPLISENPISTSRSNSVRQSGGENQENETEVQVQSSYNSEAGDKIVSIAKQYLGYSYVYGGTTPAGGFDCSGFVYYIFNSCGYNLSRSCTVQANTGVAVQKSELQPGDVLVFNNTSDGSIGHVGIYIGNGTMVHAANSRRGVTTDTINSGYYNTYYYTARRIAN